MRAVRLNAVGEAVGVETIADPVLRPGGAIVRVEAAHVPSFMAKVLSGALPYYDMPVPFTPGPGAVGMVEAVAEDVLWLTPGSRVYCDISVRSQTPGAPHDQVLIGLTTMTPEARALQAMWRDGSFAERVCWPASRLTDLGRVGEIFPPRQLAALNFLAIAYGALLAGPLAPGGSVIVNGATGVLGGCAVLVALAMGASRVVAAARDAEALAGLARLDPRVAAVALRGEEADSARLREAAGGSGADLVVDALGHVTSPEPTLAAIRALRQGGTAVLAGGVAAPIGVPYLEAMVREWTIRGAFMAPPSGPAGLVRLIEAGLLRLDAISVSAFPLAEVHQALAAAERGGGALSMVVLEP